MTTEFINWLNEYFGYPQDGELHIDPMDIPEEQWYELEDEYNEEVH